MRWFCFVSILYFVLPCVKISADEVNLQNYSDAIDKALLKSGNAEYFNTISDEVFLRRTYLNIIGRIPTFEEIKKFESYHAPTRRIKLIKLLLDSEEYREGMYPLWANMLRLQSRINGVYGDKYALWVKKCINENKPYDKMVYELMTAKGNISQNPAIGYYLRDNGNILETASTTAQIFLGTQIGCAQCHDHAFEEWTQKQFYEFTAFMGKVNTNDGKQIGEIRKNIKEEFFSIREKQILDQVMNVMPYDVKDIDTKELKLPGDYKYKNAKPNDVVKPHVFFGEQPEITDLKQRREIFAKWLTSKENPYFTKMIVNRYWKKVMGEGFFEPVDDLSSNTHINHPEVLNLLEKIMKDLNYDTKKFMEVLYNTDHYQIPAATTDGKSKEYRVLERPLVRMKAEQAWNSLLALTRKNINEYYSNDTPQPIDEYTQKLQIEGYTASNLLDIWQTIKTLADNEIIAQTAAQKKAKEASKISSSINYSSPKEIKQKEEQKKKEAQSQMQMQPKTDMMTEPEPTKLKDKLYGLASDIPSPAPDGHFLNLFGFSNHLIIEEGNLDPTLPQVLSLLNGQLTTNFIIKNSYIKRQVNRIKENEEKTNYLYQVILTRLPTKTEKDTAIAYLVKNPKLGIEDLIWALVNSREFIFIQ